VKRILFIMLVVSVLPLLIWTASCQAKKELFPYKHWTVSKPVFKAGTKGSFDDVAVKDPSIVFYSGKYHLFYTSKGRELAMSLHQLSKVCKVRNDII